MALKRLRAVARVGPARYTGQLGQIQPGLILRILMPDEGNRRAVVLDGLPGLG